MCCANSQQPHHRRVPSSYRQGGSRLCLIIRLQNYCCNRRDRQSKTGGYLGRQHATLEKMYNSTLSLFYPFLRAKEPENPSRHTKVAPPNVMHHSLLIYISGTALATSHYSRETTPTRLYVAELKSHQGHGNQHLKFRLAIVWCEPSTRQQNTHIHREKGRQKRKCSQAQINLPSARVTHELRRWNRTE